MPNETQSTLVYVIFLHLLSPPPPFANRSNTGSCALSEFAGVKANGPTSGPPLSLQMFCVATTSLLQTGRQKAAGIVMERQTHGDIVTRPIKEELYA